MIYNKLVRDNIPDIIKQSGETSVVHIAGDKEYGAKLKEKLEEEVGEFLKDDSKEELADILEVIYAICDLHKIDLQELESLRRSKAEKRGAFKKRIILEETK